MTGHLGGVASIRGACTAKGSLAGRSGWRSSPSLLVDPLVLFAVAVMAVNDRWLKLAFHNDVTGKLSDLAICFLLPFFLAEVGMLVLSRWGPWRWLVIGAILTGLGFSALELSPALAATTCQLLALVGPWIGIPGPFVMTRDPTDLLALGMLAPAVTYGSWKLRATPESWRQDRRQRTRS